MAAAAILKIHFNSHNSVTIAGIHTKFGTDTNNVPETEVPLNFASYKNHQGGGRHYEIRFNGSNSITMTYICTQFSHKESNQCPKFSIKQEIRSVECGMSHCSTLLQIVR